MGSSHTRNSGFEERARAIEMRWRIASMSERRSIAAMSVPSKTMLPRLGA